MQRILLKRTIRSFKKNVARYISLMAMIILSLFLMVGVLAAAETAITGTEKFAKEDKLEDGQFTLIMPMTDEEKEKFEKGNTVIEPMFYTDYEGPGKSTVRFFMDREKIDLIRLVEGEKAEEKDEIVLERRYATDHELKVNDSVTIAEKEFKIKGIATSADYEAPFANLGDSSVDSKKFGVAWMSEEGYDDFTDEVEGLRAEEYLYAYRLGEDVEEKDFKKDLQEGFEQFNLTSFVPADENSRIDAVSADQEINKLSAIFAGAIVVVLFAYMISIFVTHEIERDCTIIGTLYALGVKRRTLLLHYLALPVLTIFISSFVGLVLGSLKQVIDMINASIAAYYSFPDLPVVRPPELYVYALVMPTMIAVIVNWIVISKKLNRPALSMIRNEAKAQKVKKNKLHHFGYVRRFQIRQMMREFRSAITVVFGIFLCSLLLMLGLNCYVLCTNISEKTKDNIAFSYMYTYKYPDAEVPEGGTEVFGETLKLENMGYQLDVNLMGIKEDNPFFDLDHEDNLSDVTISDSMATKFALEEEDYFTLTDPSNERLYTFRVKEIIPYAPGFMTFMDIDNMRELMNKEDGYYNIVMSDHELDISPEQLYSTLTEENIISASDIFLSIMAPMIIMMTIVPVFIFIFVMYLMMRVMIDRSSKSIALFRIFGYRSDEIRKLYLDGNFFVVAIGSLICVPLSKVLMDVAYPYLISNTACGIYLEFPKYYYIFIYVAILVIYVVIDNLLIFRINKITPARILANRE